jgi:hypothetical protein
MEHELPDRERASGIITVLKEIINNETLPYSHFVSAKQKNMKEGFP